MNANSTTLIANINDVLYSAASQGIKNITPLFPKEDKKTFLIVWTQKQKLETSVSCSCCVTWFGKGGDVSHLSLKPHIMDSIVTLEG